MCIVHICNLQGAYTNHNSLFDRMYVLFKIKKRSVHVVHSDFNSVYWESIGFEEYKNKLLKYSLLYEYYDQIKFKYAYVYYYFVAKYLADNLEKENKKERIQKLVVDMVNNLYKDDYANILMFLIHLSKNEFILKQILDAAKQSFPDYNEILLQSDTEVLNELIGELPKLVVEEKMTLKKTE